jgi:hypothetical protein
MLALAMTKTLKRPKKRPPLPNEDREVGEVGEPVKDMKSLIPTAETIVWFGSVDELSKDLDLDADG